MNKINFNNNEFTTLSTEVIEAMKSAIEEFADANPNRFWE
jgi:hypothetical protein